MAEIDHDFRDWLESMARNATQDGQQGFAAFLSTAGIDDRKEATLRSLGSYCWNNEMDDENGQASESGWIAMLFLGFEIGYRHAQRHTPELGELHE